MYCVLNKQYYDIPNDYHSYIRRHLEKLEIIRDQVQQNSLESQIQMVERANQNQKALALTKGDYVYLAKDPTGVGQKLKYRHAGSYVIEKVNSPHMISLVDPLTNKTLKGPVHINRLKPAYVRMPNPCEFFLDQVVDNKGTVNEQSCANSTIGTSATSTEEDEQPQHNQQAKQPNIPVQKEVRRSKRTIQNPSRFRDENFVSSSEGSSISSEDKRLLKVKRILAKTMHNGKTCYLAHIVGEPAQNALWIQDTKIGPKTMDRIRAKPPPLLQ